MHYPVSSTNGQPLNEFSVEVEGFIGGVSHCGYCCDGICKELGKGDALAIKMFVILKPEKLMRV